MPITLSLLFLRGQRHDMVKAKNFEPFRTGKPLDPRTATTEDWQYTRKGIDPVVSIRGPFSGRTTPSHTHTMISLWQLVASHI